MLNLWKCFWGYVKVSSPKIILILLLACVFLLVFQIIQKRNYNNFKKKFKVLLSINCSFILVMTLFGRTKDDYGFIVKPFESYFAAFGENNVELQLQIIMNVVMYIPFTFFLLCCFEKIKKGHALLISFICSASIELIQRYFQIGLFEVDDVINNVLGAVIGILLYVIRVKHRAI